VQTNSGKKTRKDRRNTTRQAPFPAGGEDRKTGAGGPQWDKNPQDLHPNQAKKTEEPPSKKKTGKKQTRPSKRSRGGKGGACTSKQVIYRDSRETKQKKLGGVRHLDSARQPRGLGPNHARLPAKWNAWFSCKNRGGGKKQSRTTHNLGFNQKTRRKKGTPATWTTWLLYSF